MLVDQKPNYRDITQEDYEAMAGPDWPAYVDFSHGCRVEKFVADEIDVMLTDRQDQLNNISNFCILPFYGHEYPGNIHCCLLPDNYDIDQIRTDMLANRRSSQCQKCWTLEDAGVLSDRQIKNFTLDFYTNTDLTKLFNQAQQGNYSTVHYKINGGNYCNFTCITCCSALSTSWQELEAKEQQKTIPIIPKMLKHNDERILIDYSTAKFISFTGGESTAIRSHWDIIENLIAAKNYDCGVSFVTNGSFNFTTKQKDLLKQLPYVNFCFSVDGTERVFEYLRYPGKWSTLVDNIKWVQDQGYLASVSYTISNLNVLYHEQTINWFDQNKLPYLENPVYTPSYFSPRALTFDIKQKILQQVKHTTVVKLLSSHSENDEQLYQDFLKEIARQDRLKNIQIADYLPEFLALAQ